MDSVPASRFSYCNRSLRMRMAVSLEEKMSSRRSLIKRTAA